MQSRIWTAALATAVLAACGSNGTVGAPGADAGDGGVMESGVGPDASEGGASTRDGSIEASSLDGGDAGNIEASTFDSGDADAGGICGWGPYGTGLSGASMNDVEFDPRASGVVYASTGNRVYQSTDSGQTWHLQGSFAMGGIDSLAFPGTNPQMLMASSGAGLLSSSDSGQTWSVLALDSLLVGPVAVNPAQPLRAWAGLPGAGIVRSDDGGSTWLAVNNGLPSIQAFRLLPDPADAKTVVAGGALLSSSGTWSGGAVILTTDDGQSWQTVLQGHGVVWDVQRCATTSSVIYAATDTGVARSTDNGATWTLTTIDMNPLAAVAPVPGGTCDSVFANVQNEGPRLSIDGGKTFGPALTSGMDLTPLGIETDLAVDPQNANTVVVGTHGGLYVSTNQASSWALAPGIVDMSIRAMASSPVAPSAAWIATWGQGLWQRASDSQNWQRVSTQKISKDYFFTVVPDPLVANRIFAGSWGWLYQSSDDGVTFTMDTGTDDNVFGVAVDPTTTSTVYLATQVGGVLVSRDGGMTWQSANSGLAPFTTSGGASSYVSQIVIDPSSPQTLYAGTNGGGVFRSTDGAQSWTNVYAPIESITCLLMVPVAGNPSTVYACVSGQGIAQSTDGGTSWANLSSGLPTLDASGLIVDPMTGYLYVSAASDVYVMERGGQAWAPLDPACAAGGTTSPTVVTESGARWLLVGANGSVYRHAL